MQNRVLQSPDSSGPTEFEPASLLLSTATPSLLLGVLFLYLLRKHKSLQSKINLLTEGQAIEVKVFRIQYRADLKIEGHHPWVIQAIQGDCTDKVSSFERKFCSEPLTFDPSFYLGLNDPMTVYIDPKNPSNYCLDIRNVRNRKRTVLKKPA